MPGVYAVGDLVAGLQLAHRGFAHGIFVAEEIAHRLGRFDRAPAPVDDTGIPRVTYCDPEVASVGLTEDAATARFGSAETVTYDLGGNGKSQILKTQGFVKLVRQPGGPVVGSAPGRRPGRRADRRGSAGHRLGRVPGATSPRWLHAHPTQTRRSGEAHLALAGKPLHTHWLSRSGERTSARPATVHRHRSAEPLSG